MVCPRISFHRKVRSKFFLYLLALCLASLFGVLVTQRINRIIAGVYPSQSQDASVGKLDDYSDEVDLNDEMETTEELFSKSSTPAHTTSSSRTPPNVATNFTTPLTTRPPHVTTKRPTTPKKLPKPEEPAPKNANNTNVVTTRSPEPRKSIAKVATTTYNFGDAYATDDMHVNSKCPNRTRDKFQNSKILQSKFLETVPVLQWKKHAQESEYERLRKYAGAQGWMGVTWRILNETLNLMNSTGSGFMFDTWNGSSPCIRCAVVGNGGILNGSKMGEEIDNHDYVFRVNGAITRGFEKDVGNRTSFYFFSTNTLMNSFIAYGRQGFKSVPRTEETRFVLLPDHDRDYLLVRGALTNSIIDRGRDKGKDPVRYFGKNLTTEHFKILHPDFMRYLRNRFLWAPILNTKNRDIYRPSTGASILLAAIHTCDQVNAYGFMTPNYANFSNHYYDTHYEKVAFYANHHYINEMKLWQQLHQAGVITLYMRD